ncbi:MAG: helix-turn-helix domain-containing protein [Armatimonadetes bacterium]|nr:helix-turn-helix domain-containing protein [Armatimonadota bacterium]
MTKSALHVREIIRRLREGQSTRGIAQEMDISPNTLLKYHDWAQLEGFPDGKTLTPAGRISHVSLHLPRLTQTGGLILGEPHIRDAAGDRGA